MHSCIDSFFSSFIHLAIVSFESLFNLSSRPHAINLLLMSGSTVPGILAFLNFSTLFLMLEMLEVDMSLGRCALGSESFPLIFSK